jgi:hypothetical protein
MNKDLIIRLIAYSLITVSFIIFLLVFLSFLRSLSQEFAKTWWGK